jgi:hypothetical protein
MAIFGTMMPKLIARMIVTAVMPSAIVALRSSRVVFEMVVVARIYVKTFSFDRFAVFVGTVNGVCSTNRTTRPLWTQTQKT